MLTLSKHTAQVWSSTGLTYLSPIDLSMTLNEASRPYISADVTLPSALFTEALDPRTGARLTLRLHQAFGELLEINNLTADFGGDVSDVTTHYTPVTPRKITDDYTRPWNMFEPADPISAITAVYSGDVSNITAVFLGDVSAITKFLHTSGGSFNPAPSTFIEANLGIRSIKRNLLDGVTSVELASDEALLQDYGLQTATPYVPATNDIRTLVNYVLSKIGAVLQTGTATGTFTTAEWTPGQDAWGFIAPITQKAGLTLWCDEQRRWYLEPNAQTIGTLELSDTSNVTEITTSLNRDENYYDSCVIQYEWNDGTGNTLRQWDVYAPAGATRTNYIQYSDTPYPGAGMAQKLTERAKTRGETYNINAISNYNARPRQALTVDVTGAPLYKATTASISWTVPDDRMTITVRDLQEI